MRRSWANCNTITPVKTLVVLPIRKRPSARTGAPVLTSETPETPDQAPADPVILTSAPVVSSVGNPLIEARSAASLGGGSFVAAPAGTALMAAATAVMIVTTAVLMPMSLSARHASNHGASRRFDGGACRNIV